MTTARGRSCQAKSCSWHGRSVMTAPTPPIENGRLPATRPDSPTGIVGNAMTLRHVDREPTRRSRPRCYLIEECLLDVRGARGRAFPPARECGSIHPTSRGRTK